LFSFRSDNPYALTFSPISAWQVAALLTIFLSDGNFSLEDSRLTRVGLWALARLSEMLRGKYTSGELSAYKNNWKDHVARRSTFPTLEHFVSRGKVVGFDPQALEKALIEVLAWRRERLRANDRKKFYDNVKRQYLIDRKVPRTKSILKTEQSAAAGDNTSTEEDSGLQSRLIPKV
jgi:hypothetical protein